MGPGETFQAVPAILGFSNLPAALWQREVGAAAASESTLQKNAKGIWGPLVGSTASFAICVVAEQTLFTV